MKRIKEWLNPTLSIKEAVGLIYHVTREADYLPWDQLNLTKQDYTHAQLTVYLTRGYIKLYGQPMFVGYKDAPARCFITLDPQPVPIDEIPDKYHFNTYYEDDFSKIHNPKNGWVNINVHLKKRELMKFLRNREKIDEKYYAKKRRDKISFKTKLTNLFKLPWVSFGKSIKKGAYK